jgi:UDP-N-acetylglucosamine acyltransferase
MRIQENAFVHPSAIIEGEVVIGAGTRIGPFCYIKGPVEIGENNEICAHVIIGEGPEHRHKPGGVGVIRIGNNNVIRELTVVQRGIGDQNTTIGNNCYLMDHCHIAHDCVLADNITMAPNTVLAGHVHIHEGATIGINVSIHQFSTIGAYSMVGMGTIVTKDVFPFVVVSGAPGRFQRFNTHHFEKFHLNESNFGIENGKLLNDKETVTHFFNNFYLASRRSKFISIFDEQISAT